MENTKEEKKKHVEFSVRVPEDLDKKIKKSAEDNKRSKSGEVAFVLEKHFEAQEQNQN